jgi:hypothetical protein
MSCWGDSCEGWINFPSTISTAATATSLDGPPSSTAKIFRRIVHSTTFIISTTNAAGGGGRSAFGLLVECIKIDTVSTIFAITRTFFIAKFSAAARGATSFEFSNVFHVFLCHDTSFEQFDLDIISWIIAYQ